LKKPGKRLFQFIKNTIMNGRILVRGLEKGQKSEIRTKRPEMKIKNESQKKRTISL